MTLPRRMILAGCLLVLALNAAGAAAPPPMTIVSIKPAPPAIKPALNGALDVHVKNLGLMTDQTLGKFTLYLNGYKFPALKATPSGKDTLRFPLVRPSEDDAESKATVKAWNEIVGAPTAQLRDVAVALRYDGALVDGSPITGKFRVLDGTVAWFWILFILALDAVFIIAAMKTNILRDTIPPQPPKGDMRPYSLARFQMAWWFLIIVGSFVFIFAVTQEWRTINDEALILMGIGTGTALGATMIEVVKQNNADSTIGELEKAKAEADAAVVAQQDLIAALPQSVPPTALELQAIGDAKVVLAGKVAAATTAADKLTSAKNNLAASLSAPVSQGFLRDVLTDADGASVHRFQMLGWTFVLGIIYLYGVWKSLALPEFSATLNVLLGISAGTYLGFKLPEKQA